MAEDGRLRSRQTAAACAQFQTAGPLFGRLPQLLGPLTPAAFAGSFNFPDSLPQAAYAGAAPFPAASAVQCGGAPCTAPAVTTALPGTHLICLSLGALDVS